MILDYFLSDFKYNLVTNTKNQRLMKQDEIFGVETGPPAGGSGSGVSSVVQSMQEGRDRRSQRSSGIPPKGLHTSCFLRWNFYGSDIRSIKQADLLTGVSERAVWGQKSLNVDGGGGGRGGGGGGGGLFHPPPLRADVTVSEVPEDPARPVDPDDHGHLRVQSPG